MSKRNIEGVKPRNYKGPTSYTLTAKGGFHYVGIHKASNSKKKRRKK